MNKLLVLSGKGGTGKTTVTAAFISLENAEAFADCDVDAPNLHLVMQGLPAPKVSDYYGMGKAEIDTTRCVSCGLCMLKCRFDAIIQGPDGTVQIDLFKCEGCGLCEALCPVNAIRIADNIAGQQLLYRIESPERSAIFSTAELKTGSGTSGKLVSEVKKQLFSEASGKAAMALIDGSPGIGCPVIASISGVDFVLIVAEPSVSGISDMKRVIETARYFKVRIAVCVNKADTNIERSNEIERFCAENDLPFAGRIPYDEKVTQITNEGKTVDCSDGPAGKTIREIFLNVKNLMIGEEVHKT